MKVSLNWLADYITLPTDDVAVIREAFESLGHEVEGVDVLEPDWTEVVIAEVVSVEPHPDADKLRVCQVASGQAEPLQVVCGAPNVRAGGKYPLAPVGACLPGDFRIRKSKLRGVESFGMICFEQELQLAESASGIMELPADAPAGTALTDYLALPAVGVELEIRGDVGRVEHAVTVGVKRIVATFTNIQIIADAVAVRIARGVVARAGVAEIGYSVAVRVDAGIIVYP